MREKGGPLVFPFSGEKIRGEEEDHQKSMTALNIYPLCAVSPSKTLLRHISLRWMVRYHTGGIKSNRQHGF